MIENEDVCQLLQDSRIKNFKDLGALIHTKTKGNSFFVHQFIKNIADRGFIANYKESIEWVVEMKEMQELKISENVVDFMQQRIQKFDKETLNVLSKNWGKWS